MRAVPDDDHAQFGLGLAMLRQGRLVVAVEHLALASAMRPERTEYTRALREARATVAARIAGGLDPDAVGGRSAPEKRSEGSEGSEGSGRSGRSEAQRYER